MNKIEFLAEMCSYAQSHCGDPDAWPLDIQKREELLQCTSYQVACFLAQNTVLGYDGVDWCVAIDELTDTKLDKNGMMKKSVKQWTKILNRLVKEHGGMK